MTEWLALAALASALELDATAAGQVMVSRPIVVGPVLGLFLGAPATGAGIGVLCELFLLDSLPLGGVVPLNGAVFAATALLATAPPFEADPRASFFAALALALLYRPVERALRRGRSRWNRVLEEDPADSAVARAVARSLAAEFAATFLFVAAAASAAGASAAWAWEAAPAWARAGADGAVRSMLLIGAASLVHRLSPWGRR